MFRVPLIIVTKTNVYMPEGQHLGVQIFTGVPYLRFKVHESKKIKK